MEILQLFSLDMFSKGRKEKSDNASTGEDRNSLLLDNTRVGKGDGTHLPSKVRLAPDYFIIF